MAPRGGRKRVESEVARRIYDFLDQICGKKKLSGQNNSRYRHYIERL
jgi:hypothetical protein